MRSGALAFDESYLPSGGTPNAFAAPFAFSTPYTYNSALGSGIVLELRYSASTGAAFSMDAGSTSSQGNAWRGNGIAATTGSSSNVAVVQFTYTVVPEAGSLALFGAGLAAFGAGVVRRRK